MGAERGWGRCDGPGCREPACGRLLGQGGEVARLCYVCLDRFTAMPAYSSREIAFLSLMNLRRLPCDGTELGVLARADVNDRAE